MRRISEVVLELKARGETPLAQVLFVSAQAVARATARDDYDLVVEIDEQDGRAKARARAGGADATQWADLDEAWLTEALAALAERPRLARVNSWPLLSRLVTACGLTFAAVDHLVFQGPPAAGEAETERPTGAVAALLGPIGFAVVETALPVGQPKKDLIFIVASRAAVDRNEHWKAALARRLRAPADTPAAVEATAFEIAGHDVAFGDGYATGRIRLAAAPGGQVFVAVFAGGAPVSIAEARPDADGDGRDLTFSIWAAPELFAATERSLTVAAFPAPSPTPIARLSRPAGRRFVPEDIIKAQAERLGGAAPKAPFGVLMIGGARETPFAAALKSLCEQGAADVTHVWLDGDPARDASRAILDANAETARAAGCAEVRAFGGRLGADKLMIHALDQMTRRCDAFLVIDDGCFPSRDAVATMRAALDAGRSDAALLSVYGQPFGVEDGVQRFGRFQSRGWAAYGERLAPLLPKLAYLYSLEETDFLAWTAERLTDEVRAAIDLTPGRQPSETLRCRFAWDEALGLIAALDGLSHAPTVTRVVFDCGPAEGVAADPARLREPPFNLVDADELWARF